MSVPSELLLSIPPCMNIWRVRVTRELLISICPMYKYLSIQARRVLRALKGLVSLKSLVQGHSVKRQATSTLRYMNAYSVPGPVQDTDEEDQDGWGEPSPSAPALVEPGTRDSQGMQQTSLINNTLLQYNILNLHTWLVFLGVIPVPYVELDLKLFVEPEIQLINKTLYYSIKHFEPPCSLLNS